MQPAQYGTQARVLQRVEQTTGDPAVLDCPPHQQHEEILEQQVQRLGATWRLVLELLHQGTDYR
ncbi:hypothetical protein D3C85_1743850 [compost metagenome]